MVDLADLGYFADPFVLRTPGGYVAYGTVPPDVAPGRTRFRMATSPDLVHWQDAGGALEPVGGLGDDYWAPEVAFHEDRYYMYYSAGHGERGHHLRVATSDAPTGPFRDEGVNLTPGERFAIDAHPFRDDDGTWYLYHAHDVLTGPRVGTMIAVDRMVGMTALAGEARTILRPDADWQIYERERAMYGRVFDWHTLEGPSVVHRRGRYYCFFSGGAWGNDTYGVSWAEADHPLGPWRRSATCRRVLRTERPDAVGPGHTSITTRGVLDVMAFHAWDAAHTARRMHLATLHWGDDGPRVEGY